MDKIIGALAVVALVIALVLGGIIPLLNKGKDSSTNTQTNQTAVTTNVDSLKTQ